MMLDWTTAGHGPSLGILLHHDDAEREFVYDLRSAAGRLDRALVEAPGRGWATISMQRDWVRVFPGDEDADASGGTSMDLEVRA